MTEKEKKDTINKWINLYTNDLFNWALYKVSSKETTEDLVQDTFVAAFSGLEKFKNNSSPKSWLFSILNNKHVLWAMIYFEQKFQSKNPDLL